MPNGKTAVTAHFDPEEEQMLSNYMARKGLKKNGNAVRKLTVQALEERDPRNSWLLHIGIAAMLWSVLSLIGTYRFGSPPADITMFSITMAGVFLWAHAVQLVHAYGVAGIPLVGRLFGRPVDR
jgi:hypothetical protein